MATFNGTLGPDVLEGDTEADILNGGVGGDVLFGNGNNDTLNGDAGDDVLDGGPGADNLNGGAGFDAATYVNAGAGVTVTLQAGATVMEGTATAGGGGDTLTSIEAVHGSNQNDTIRVTSRLADEIFLRGNGGADILEGPSTPGASVWATYFTATQGIVAIFDSSGAGYRFTVEDGTPVGAALASIDTLINIWALAGGNYGDVFTGETTPSASSAGAGTTRSTGVAVRTSSSTTSRLSASSSISRRASRSTVTERPTSCSTSRTSAARTEPTRSSATAQPISCSA